MYALALALFLLRTNTTTNGWEGRGVLQNLGCGKELPTLDVLDESRNVNTYRTAFHTRRDCTIQAAFGFGQCLFFIQAEVDFLFPAVRTVFGV